MFPALVRSIETEKAYKTYVSDTLRFIAENTAYSASYFTGGDMGKYPNMRFSEIYEEKPVETRTPEEVISHIRQKLKEARE